jgi:hypothetical protein
MHRWYFGYYDAQAHGYILVASTGDQHFTHRLGNALRISTDNYIGDRTWTIWRDDFLPTECKAAIVAMGLPVTIHGLEPFTNIQAIVQEHDTILIRLRYNQYAYMDMIADRGTLKDFVRDCRLSAGLLLSLHDDSSLYCVDTCGTIHVSMHDGKRGHTVSFGRIAFTKFLAYLVMHALDITVNSLEIK